MSAHKLTVSACPASEGRFVECLFEIGELRTDVWVKVLAFRNVSIRAGMHAKGPMLLRPHLVLSDAAGMNAVALRGTLVFTAEVISGGPNDGSSEIRELMVGLGVPV